MGFLDQVFDDDEVEAEQVGVEGVVNATSLLASKQAMRDGYRNEGGIDTTISIPDPSEKGEVDISEGLNQAFDYKRLIIEKQTKPLRYRDTADDWFTGGIKDGGNVMIRIIDEGKDKTSWQDLARHELVKGEEKTLLFDKFSVTNVMEPDQERYQLVETFGSNIIYGFGRRPRMLRFSGQILNGEMKVERAGEVVSMDWAKAFQRKYEQHYRLTKCIQERKKILIHAQDTLYTGYLLTMNVNTTAMEQGASNVVISCILDKKTYPEHHDEKIPGDFTESGARIGGAETPDSLFPEARIESFIRTGAVDFLENKINQFKSERKETVSKLVEEAGKDKATVDGTIEKLDNFSPDDKFSILNDDARLHQILYQPQFKFSDALSTYQSMKSSGKETQALNLKSGLVKRIERANSQIEDAIHTHEKIKEFKNQLDEVESLQAG